MVYKVSLIAKKIYFNVLIYFINKKILYRKGVLGRFKIIYQNFLFIILNNIIKVT